MPTRFPVTTRNSTALKASGAAPNSALQCTAEESRFLIGAKEVTAPTAPSNTVAPAVTGTATNGSTLTCTQGTWTGSNIQYEYEWQQNAGGGFDKIRSGNGATTFVLTAAQVGSTIRCVVRARNGGVNAVAANSNTTATIT